LRKLIAMAAASALLAVAAVPAFGATKSVSIGDNWFVHKSGVPTVTVKKGDTVKWTWRGKRRHNVHAVSGPRTFSSAVKKKGTYSKRMTRKGTYRIICDIHGGGDQSMRLVVK
jgi:plastocyanin